MADNIAAKSDATTTVGTLAADDISSVLYMRNKITLGADGVNDGDVSSANPMPVTGTVAVSGSALPSGAATAALQSTGNTLIAAVGSTLGTPFQAGGSIGNTTFASTQSGTWTVQPGNTANTTAWKVDGSAVTQPVSLASVPSHEVTNAGTFAVQSAAAGDVAHDASDSGNPIKQGFKATTSLAGLTLVANADRTDGFAGVDGVQIVRPHCNLENIVSGVVAITDGSSTSGIAAQGAGIKVYVTTVIIANTSATAVTVDLRDGTAGTVKATFPVPASTSGVVCNLPVPLPFSANTIVAVDPSASASTVTTTIIGFTSKV